MTKRHYPPSVLKYRKNNPSVACRMPLDLKYKLESICSDLGTTKAKLVHDFFIDGINHFDELQVSLDKAQEDENKILLRTIKSLEDEIARLTEINEGIKKESSQLHEAKAELNNVKAELKRLTDILTIVDNAITEAKRSMNYMELFETLKALT